MTPRYSITAYWGPRQENPEACAERLLHMLAPLSLIDPVFSDWFFLGLRKGTHLAALGQGDIAKLIAEGVYRGDSGEPFPQGGYRFGAANGLKRVPRGVSVRVHAGNLYPANYFNNVVSVSTERLNEENATFINLRVFKSALLAVAAAWDATWCGAYPDDLLALRTKPDPPRPLFGLSWITFNSARFAPMITPPRSAIVENAPGGGLLMIATEERFSTQNPQHLAVARDIEAALAPVNALPWPPDGEPQP
jgi:hypothetical protein